MAAIQPARLKQQVAPLRNEFPQTDLIIRRLHDLFDFYADRTHRHGLSGSQTPRLPHYTIPLPVMRQLEFELSAGVRLFGGEAALCLADALWSEGYFETRLLAAHLLREAPASPEALASRLEDWAKPGEDTQVLQILISAAKVSLDKSKPGFWLELIQGWVDDDSVSMQVMGLRALHALVRDPDYENFPPVFTILGPITQTAPQALYPDLTAVLETLAKRSPIETAYFLRHVLITAPDPRSVRLVRRCLPQFDAATQQKLREALLSRAKLGEGLAPG